MSREFVRRHRRLWECREGRREASGRATSCAEAIWRCRLFVFHTCGRKNPYDLPQLDLRPQGFLDGSLHPIFKIAARKDSDVLESGCPEIARDPLALATTDHGDVRPSLRHSE
jgi:hypothetical protein